MLTASQRKAARNVGARGSMMQNTLAPGLLAEGQSPMAQATDSNRMDGSTSPAKVSPDNLFGPGSDPMAKNGYYLPTPRKAAKPAAQMMGIEQQIAMLTQHLQSIGYQGPPLTAPEQPQQSPGSLMAMFGR